MSDPALYCKIFVDFNGGRDALLRVAAPDGARIGEMYSFESDELSVDVRENEDFDASNRDGEEGFLRYRYHLDVDPLPSVPRVAYVQAVDALLGRLRSAGSRAVPACDFEDELHRVL